MPEISIPRPLLIALVGVILVGGFLVMKGGSNDAVAPEPTTTAATSATGASGASAKVGATAATGATGASGASGASGATAKVSVVDLRKQRAIEARKKLVAAAEEAGIPTPVYSSLQDGKAVIIFFWQPQGKDDERVDDALKNLKKFRGKELVVIKEPISNKSKYDGIAQAAEITQTPGVIMLYGDKADAVQGYYDDTALNIRLTRLTGDSGEN